MTQCFCCGASVEEAIVYDGLAFCTTEHIAEYIEALKEAENRVKNPS